MFNTAEQEIEITHKKQSLKLTAEPHPRGLGYMPVIYRLKKSSWELDTTFPNHNRSTKCLCMSWLKRKFDLLEPEVKEKAYSREMTRMSGHITSLAS